MSGWISGTWGPQGKPIHPPGNLTLSLSKDRRDARDPGELGAALLALRRRAPKAPLSALYDRHEAMLADAGR